MQPRRQQPETALWRRSAYSCFGPNGKGKSTGIVIPHLLQSSGSSIVVVDPKGELAAVTAEYRRTLGRVVILNPFALLANRRGYEDLKGCGFNPLAR